MDEVAVLRSLLEAYSPSGAEVPAVHAFLDVARSFGFRTEVDGVGNGFARVGSGRPQLMFLGHIDTVEGELPVRVEGNRAVGRGACDAKGPLAAGLVAAGDHAGPGEIVIVAAVGEEKDSAGARHLIPRHRPDLLIVGEPSGWDGVTIGYKGNLSLEFTFGGERRHLSSPEPTTVERALTAVGELRKLCDEHRGSTPYSSLTAKVDAIRTVRKGTGEQVVVDVNLRLPLGIRVSDVLAFLDASDLGGTYRVIDRSDAVEVDRRNPVVRALLAGIRTEGGEPVLRKKSGSSDLNLAVPAWGCPAAAYGPGDAHLDHTDAEALDLEEYRKSIRVLRLALETLAATRAEVAVSAAARGRP